MLFLSHLKGWELHPPSNYQLSSGWMSRCCPSPAFTVSDKRIALPDLPSVSLLPSFRAFLKYERVERSASFAGKVCYPVSVVLSKSDISLPQQYHRPLQVARVSLAKLHQFIIEWAGC